jgi:hypothetical protein
MPLQMISPTESFLVRASWNRAISLHNDTFMNLHMSFEVTAQGEFLVAGFAIMFSEVGVLMASECLRASHELTCIVRKEHEL